ncbi:MAG: glycoside hydrolase [Candidatus Ratteibacteria bacterium]|nr:glycoside hydrolase [Candidatus Ratteibacteria bacterium]
MKRLLNGKIIVLICMLGFFILFCCFAVFNPPVFPVVVLINSEETYQTIEGFGASITYYESFLINHPQKEDIYNCIFEELGLSILRVRNSYEYEDNFIPETAQVIEDMRKYSHRDPIIIMSVWSPPVELKSNNEKVGGTLKKDEDGKFMYDAFAQYWVDSLNAYKKLGVEPTYIAIENEPSWGSHEACMFKETETYTTAGYNRALEEVYKKLKTLEYCPKILGPEVHGIGYNTFQNYAARFNHDLLDGYCYHLYHGGDGANNNPDSFIDNLKRIAKSYPGKPIFQTEYHRGDWFNTAWIMHNCLVYGNVSAYLYWDLIWAKDRGTALVEIESPNRPKDWTTQKGYVLSDKYYAFRQYSKFISPGYKRVSAHADSRDLRVSAYISPNKDSMTVVVLNVSKDKQEVISIKEAGFKINGGDVIRTSQTEKGENAGKYNLKKAVLLPPRSITTLALDIESLIN